MEKNNNIEETGYLFNVDILVRSKTNALALQSLIQLINNNEGDVIDYRVKSGIELGEIIEATVAAKRRSILQPKSKASKAAEVKETNASSSNQGQNKEQADSTPKMHVANGNPIEVWVQSYISSNRLVRLVIERSKGRVNIPCRILNYLAEAEMLSVYHVDEKQVYTYKLSEIIDILDV